MALCKYNYVLNQNAVKLFLSASICVNSNSNQLHGNNSLRNPIFRKTAEHIFLYTAHIISFTHVDHPSCPEIESVRPDRKGPLPGTEIDQQQPLRMGQGLRSPSRRPVERLGARSRRRKRLDPRPR